MNIVKYKKQVREALLAFQSANHFERIRLLDADSGCGRTVYLEENGQILGIGTLYKNAFHPHFDQLQFAVDTSNHNVVTALYAALLQSDSEAALPLSICLREADADNLQSFLEHAHFTLTLKCECPDINIDASLQDLLTQDTPAGFRFKQYRDLTAAETESLRQFRLNGYLKTHFWSPPLEMDSPDWQETDLGPEDKNISWAVFDNETLILCSDAHIEGDTVYLGWGWHDDAYENRSELQSIWSHVLKRQLDFCKLTGKRLIGEFDSTDKYGQYKSALLTHLTPDNYFIYQQGSGSTR